MNFFRLYAVFVVLSATIIPQITSAANCAVSTSAYKGIAKFLLYPTCLINTYVVPLAIALEVVLFLFGVIRYISKADNESERKQGSKFIMWGIIALFVTVSFWGIVGLLFRSIQIGT